MSDIALVFCGLLLFGALYRFSRARPLWGILGSAAVTIAVIAPMFWGPIAWDLRDGMPTEAPPSTGWAALRNFSELFLIPLLPVAALFLVGALMLWIGRRREVRSTLDTGEGAGS